MTYSLTSVRIKIDRAKKHLADIEAEIKAFFDSNPYTFVKDKHSQPGKHLCRVRVHRTIPAMWGAIVGDCVHNLRTALDHLAVILVSANGGTPTRYTSFPIGADRTQFETSAIRGLTGASPVAIAIAKRLKPYGGSNRNPALFQLSGIDNKDKHWLLIPVAVAYHSVGVSLHIGLPGPGNWVMQSPFFEMRPAQTFSLIEDNAILFSVPARKEVQADFKVSFNIAFGKGQVFDGEPLLPTLKQLIDFTERTIDIFARRALKASW